MSLRIAATRLTELHTVKLMIGGNGGVNPSSDSQTLNVCDGGLFCILYRKVLPRYIDAFSIYWGKQLRNELRERESVVSLVGLTR